MPHLDVRNELVDELARIATSHLHARLLAHPGERGASDALDGRVRRERPELGHLVHAGEIESLPLRAAEACHERQVVVGAPPGVAFPVPVAGVAVIDGLGVGRSG